MIAAEAVLIRLSSEGDSKDGNDRAEPLQLIRRHERLLYECPECGRILWQSGDGVSYR